MTALLTTANGGIPVVIGGPAGAQITGPGQLQFGDMLTGGGTSAGWRELVGWRDLPAASVADAQRPQAHGAYAGSVFGDSLAVTYTCLIRGRVNKLAALETFERFTQMDGVERWLAVNDGAGVTMRLARVVARSVPMDKAFAFGPAECAVQFLCADPRRYSLNAATAAMSAPVIVGGLGYPLVYPLDYGTSTGGAAVAVNSGTAAAPFVATFTGPLTNPGLSSSDGWALRFNLALAAGETLVVDTKAGTAQLGTADRLYAIAPNSDLPEQCQLSPGSSTLSLSAAAGTGGASVTYRHTYM